MFQQDGAPSHASDITQAHLGEASPQFIEKNEWPPQCPGYTRWIIRIWDSLKEKVYRGLRETNDTGVQNRIIMLLDKIQIEKIRKRILFGKSNFV